MEAAPRTFDLKYEGFDTATKVQILTTMRELLARPQAWGKGSYKHYAETEDGGYMKYEDTGETIITYCLVGAAKEACNVLGFAILDGNQDRITAALSLNDLAKQRLESTLTDEEWDEIIGESESEDLSADYCWSIAFNDLDRTEHADVLRLIDDKIDSLALVGSGVELGD